jgi:ABC-type Fe2+-enterobactin transport system substrate-binding protein
MSASSVVLKGIDARTFTEMESFVKDLEARPVERLLRDLSELCDLPTTKVSLVSYVLAGKYRASEPEERERMRESVAATVESLPDGETRERVAAILDRMR